MKKNNTEDLFSMFNLPSYIKGKSFSDASKVIQKRFEGRTDKESVETQKDLLGRLRKAQDYVKSTQEASPQPQQGAPQEQFALGGIMGPGDKDKIDPNNPPTTKNPEFSDEQHSRQNAATGIDFISKEENVLMKPYVEDKAAELNMGRFKDMGYFDSKYNGGMYNMSPTSKNPANADVYKDNLRYIQSLNPDVRINNNGHKNGFIPMSQRGTNDHFLGGLLGGSSGGANAASAIPGLGGAMSATGAEGMPGAPGAAGYLGVANSAFDMAKTAFGKTGIDTNGTADPGAYQNEAAKTGMGALKGAKAGMTFGPVGAAIGGVLGGASSLLGANKANKDISEAKKNNTYASVGQIDNSYALGGMLGDLTDPNFFSSIARMGNQLNTNPFNPSKTDYASNSGDPYREKIQSYENSNTQDPLVPQAKTNVNNLDTNKVAGQDKLKTSEKVSETKGGSLRGSGSDLLRYAPAAMNAAQLLSLKKPEFEGLDRLGNRYERQLTDEEALQNLVREGTSNNRDAIIGASGGSGSAARANLIGSQLQGTKALSDSYIRGNEANKQENRTAQQFNLGVDQTNLSQSNQENDINARNKGNYETQKSKLLAQLGDDLGGIGTEELFKKYPEMMGMYYDSKGRLIKNKKK